MTTIHNNGKTIVAVPVPEDVKGITVYDNTPAPTLRYLELSTMLVQIVNLPEGNWTILGKLSELSDKDCEPLIENWNSAFDDKTKIYENYYGVFKCNTAKESFISLLKANGVDINNELLVLVKND